MGGDPGQDPVPVVTELVGGLVGLGRAHPQHHVFAGFFTPAARQGQDGGRQNDHQNEANQSHREVSTPEDAPVHR